MIYRNNLPKRALLTAKTYIGAQQLPPIEADPKDPASIKRARNTWAARVSRAKRVEHTETLENEVRELSEEVELWKSRAMEYGHPGE